MESYLTSVIPKPNTYQMNGYLFALLCGRASLGFRVAAFVLAFVLAGTVTVGMAAPTLLVPAYQAEVGIRAIETRGSAPITLIFNPDDGPGQAPLADYQRLYRRAAAAGVPLLAYVDLVDFSARPAKQKSVAVLEWERRQYKALYGSFAGWFFDDLWPTAHAAVLQEVVSWKGQIVGNPGTALVPWPSGFDSLIWYEGPLAQLPKPLPRQQRNLGFIFLQVEPGAVAAAWRRSASCRYLYLAAVPDNWRSGVTAYDKLPPYWAQLTWLATQ